VEAVASAAGFGSLRRMDRAFARLLGTTPREFRARFQGATP
jgi:transcriptional regulator GlxA family with amidase domain